MKNYFVSNAGQRMKDYQHVICAIQSCEDMLENFKRSFEVLEKAKTDIFDDATRRAAFAELVQLDTDTTLTALQEQYSKYKAVNNWLTANL